MAERKSAAIEVYRNEKNDIIVKWDTYGTDDTYVCFPVAQAKQVCEWIMEVAAEITEEELDESEPIQNPK